MIKADIKRVLDRMQVQYRETKGGFECIHLPSIDLSSVQDSPKTPSRHQKRGSSGSNDAGQSRRSMARKTSKLSFGLSNKDRPSIEEKEKEKDKTEGEKGHERELLTRPSGDPTLNTSPSSGSSSFFNLVSNAQSVLADANRSQEPNGATVGTSTEDTTPRSQSPAKAKILPPIPRDFAATAPRATSPAPATPLPTGEVDKDVFETMGASALSARFDINIVKVSFWLCI